MSDARIRMEPLAVLIVLPVRVGVAAALLFRETSRASLTAARLSRQPSTLTTMNAANVAIARAAMKRGARAKVRPK